MELYIIWSFFGLLIILQAWLMFKAFDDSENTKIIKGIVIKKGDFIFRNRYWYLIESENAKFKIEQILIGHLDLGAVLAIKIDRDKRIHAVIRHYFMKLLPGVSNTLTFAGARTVIYKVDAIQEEEYDKRREV